MTTTMALTPSRVLDLQLLGPPQLHLQGQGLTDQISGRPLALLSYLVVTGLPHTRDVLADLLWTDLGNQQARNNLRYLLPELRKLFGDYLTVTTKSISFNRTLPYFLDIDVLRTTVTAKAETVSSQRLQTAVDLYRGEFLAGFSIRHAPVFEEWVVVQRAHMRHWLLQGLYTLAERYCAEGNSTVGLNTTQRLLQLDPWHEAGHRLQMQFLAASGHRSAAIEHYQDLRQKLAHKWSIEPTTETRQLYTQLSHGEWSDKKITIAPLSLTRINVPAVTMAALPAIKHNLPGQLTTFIGRQEEITELRASLLATNNRLITLIGEGGIGKTRLALTVAQSIIDLSVTLTRLF